jgi:hypothetical protein
VRLLKAEKKANQMLKQVQKHDVMVRFWSFCHPELVSGSRGGVKNRKGGGPMENIWGKEENYEI